MSKQTPRSSQSGRGRSASVDVAIVMIGVALLSVFVVGAFDYYAVRTMLLETIEGQMGDIVASRATRIEDGFGEFESLARTVAADNTTVRALTDLTGGYEALEESLSATQTQELRSTYEQGLASAVPTGVAPPSVAEVFPTSDRAQYLQYWYITQNPFEDRAELNDAGDGTLYSEMHAVHHPTLRTMSEVTGAGDLLLIDAESESVVYTVDKRADFGTDLTDGPHEDSALAEVVLDHVRTAAADEAVLIDFERYDPAGGDAQVFIAAPVREGGSIIGAAVLEIPNELVTHMTTAGQDWEGTGLGETGETYFVGADKLLRSESRAWLEDHEAYLEALADEEYDQDVIDKVVAYDSTVLAQPVETEAVETALDGDDYVGLTTNYLGQDTITVAQPLQIGTMQWVVVADVAMEEAAQPLANYLRTLSIIAIFLIPAVGIFGVVVSRRLLRPIVPIADAAERVTEGDLDVRLPDFGRDEYGDVAAKFNELVGTLRQQEVDLRTAEDETTELLKAVMPSQLAEQFLAGDRDIAEAKRNATLVAIIAGQPGSADPTEQEALADDKVAISAGISALADKHGAELLQSSATQQLYAMGLASDDERAAEAVAFTMAARRWVEQKAESEALTLGFSAGVAAGDVVVGVVGTDRTAFAVWGAPRRRAGELASVASPGQVLVGPSVAGKIGSEWLVEPMTDLVDLEGAAMDGWSVVGPHPNPDPSGAVGESG